MNTRYALFGACAAITLSGCVKDFEGEYANPDSVEIVDDRWNETDARTSAEKLIGSMLRKAWLRQHNALNRGKPVVIVGDMENRTDEHVDLKALVEATRNELINSGQIRFVNAAKRAKILEEINYQQGSGMVSGSTAKRKGRQTGADYFLDGALSANVHTRGGKKLVTYQVNMILTNLESSEIVWSENHRIKKRFKRSGAGW